MLKNPKTVSIYIKIKEKKIVTKSNKAQRTKGKTTPNKKRHAGHTKKKKKTSRKSKRLPTHAVIDD